MEKIEANITKAGGYTGTRMSKDKLFKHVMTIGGLSVIIAISLIFIYLASVVVPMFMPATMEPLVRHTMPGATAETTVHLTAEEQAEIGVRFTAEGGVSFFNIADGQSRGEARLALPAGAKISSFATGDLAQKAVAYGLADGRMIVTEQGFKVTFLQDTEDSSKDIRTISPSLAYPLGEAPLLVDDAGQALSKLTVQHRGTETTAVALTEDKRLVMAAFESRENMITGEVTTERSSIELPMVEGEIRQLMLEVKQRDLYVLHGERFVSHYDVMNKREPKLVQTIAVVPEGQTATAITILSGGYSLIVGSNTGEIAQWFLVRDDNNVEHLTHIRAFKPMGHAIATLAPEHYRKGFLAGDIEGNIGLYYATSNRQMLTRAAGSDPVLAIGIAPRANAILVQNGNASVQTAKVDNDYPEVSFSSLWQKVWYESYQEPEYNWQSSAATSDFEPKLSVAPLTFGTLKAAFYAMLVAVPLAVMGAIFAAYFMSPKMRSVVKPSIEVMEALPTVILGFLAGLWLAPFVDNNLAGTFVAIFMLPSSFLITAWIWHKLPEHLTQRVGPGWEAALLIPVIILVFWASIAIGHPIEAAFFGGDMPHWVTNELGWNYEQRNSLVVGVAMGFAVIPTIFSIAEDAVFSVPKHLTTGSLALGATPWQTLFYVVLLTASPGIFSAIMVGMGRAVGETMIVLMATGNTAVMDMSIFTGFRTLSANIGVEMPEAAVGTVHYRLLFFSALVLFAFTFVVNTIAELVRQRLREKYSSL
ncbi:MAG: ABC transporter permease subunit [Rhodocyclaceae bacterium]|nr:ABC transporter permease subunit [Rhodocyclaceae bacterium]MDZ4213275.1 ABC transporter permease subunit [Rhodocyclaceae bacterium]